jgi:hypothetical protein
LFSPSYENTTPIPKLEAFVAKTKGLQGFAQIKSGVFMKKTFKDSKISSASIPQ